MTIEATTGHVTAALAPSGDDIDLYFRGRFPFGIDRWAYVPFDVPPRGTANQRQHIPRSVLGVRCGAKCVGSGDLRPRWSRPWQRRGVPWLVGRCPGRLHAVSDPRNAGIPAGPD